MKVSAMIIILLASITGFAQQPKTLGFPLGLTPNMNISDFKAQMEKKSFQAVKKWQERGRGKDSVNKYDRSEELWKTTDLYKDFTKDFNLTELSYGGLSPSIGGVNPTDFTAFFCNDKLVAVAIIINSSTSFSDMYQTLQFKYGNSIFDEALIKNQGNKFSIWDDKKIKIQLNNNNPRGDFLTCLEYIDIEALKNAKISKPAIDSKDF